ncbi:MAG TPA: C4-dicarboxylate transporter [Nitrosomonas sp.]|nr:C4-dicarboxylate transporter [Nitrosomonas sp.]
MKQCHVIIKNNIRDFYPANFAMVMATGIVSIAFEMMNFPGIAGKLCALNMILYLILCAILAVRIMFFLPNLMTDLKILQRAFLLLTFVVGTNTVGIQLIIFYQATALATLLWFIALTGWFTCVYFICFNFMQKKTIFYEIVTGATLLIAVSTVSIALLGIRLLDALHLQADSIYFVMAGFWTLGFALYLMIITPLTYRLFFVRFEIRDWNAPYWICMGATAIITLAGCEFIARAPDLPTWEGIRGAVFWITVIAWIIGTLWIPYLLFMDIRKFTHVNTTISTPIWIKIFPWAKLAFGTQYHAYEPSSWSRVFPTGMYTASTLLLASAADSDALAIISRYWGWFALLIWSLTCMGMLRFFIYKMISYKTIQNE